MLVFLALAALSRSTAGATPSFAPITSISDVTAAAGVSVRIFEQFGHLLSLDPNYPGAPEFSPVIGAPQLPTGSPSIEDASVFIWFLVPQDNSTVKIQSVLFPDMFISYPTFGVSPTPPTHAMLVLRDNANAALFSITPINGVAHVKLRCLLVRSIKVPAVGNLTLTTWATILNDTAVPDPELPNPRFYSGLAGERIEPWPDCQARHLYRIFRDPPGISIVRCEREKKVERNAFIRMSKRVSQPIGSPAAATSPAASMRAGAASVRVNTAPFESLINASPVHSDSVKQERASKPILLLRCRLTLLAMFSWLLAGITSLHPY
ncbi:hypothetical protein C8R44DRAFT_752819 [Mycena epipterygia]|nr:hypothetical protein C8R44DRAFT_752819 [Mycena epipterygia]